jgi:NAD(P)-dependent dehydrogenase (short-subunit alcohol dehydrogenase family)
VDAESTMSDLFSLAGKTALVTGGGRGIGRMISEGFLRAGARVIVTSRKEADLTGTVSDLGQYGDVRYLVSDLSTEDGCRSLAERVSADEDSLDVLVNNAGAAWGAPLEEFPASGWDKVLDLNVKGVFELTQHSLPLLRASSVRSGEPARVINIGSIDGIKVPGAGMTNYSYSASKAAVHMLTRHLAFALAPDVLVNAIAPGPFETQMLAPILANRRDEVEGKVPLKRIGRPEDMAGIAIYLASRASSFVTGAVIPVDGGISTVG